MKRILIIVLVLSQSMLVAQLRPTSYKIEESRTLKKLSDNLPISNSITDILVDDEGIIWLGTSRGLSKSEDDGTTWTNYYNHPDFGEEGIIAIGYNEGVIWASTGHSTEIEGGTTLPEGSGIRYSTDRGDSWNVIKQPVDNPGDSSLIYGINTIRALPVTVNINNITYDIAFTKNTVWIANFAGGLRKSTDMGVSWHRVLLPSDSLNSIKPTDTLNYSLQTVAGNFGKDSWLNHRVFSVVAADSATLYVGTAGGINK
jgi:hypothetical protein